MRELVCSQQFLQSIDASFTFSQNLSNKGFKNNEKKQKNKEMSNFEP